MRADSMLESVPFRFLDLPKELRFMVYENITISTKHVRLLPLEDRLQIDHRRITPFSDQPGITIILETLPVQIFITCRTVYFEALPFLSQKLENIRQSAARLIVDSDCLYTHALHSTQTLLRALLDNLNQHSFFNSKPGSVSSQPKDQGLHLKYPPQVQQWLIQTTHLLLSQRPLVCPFSGFMGTSTYPTVRLIVEVPHAWKYTTYHDLAAEAHAQIGAPPVYTASVVTQLTEIWNDLAGYTKGLKHVKSGAIVFGQNDERVVTKDALVVKKTVALDFGLCRIVQ